MIQTRLVHSLPPAPPGWDDHRDLSRLDWSQIPALSPFRRHDDSGFAAFQTEARLCADAQTLYVRFDCQDPHIWGTYRDRDQPIYDEEVVELFLAPGEADPKRYFEFEVSPNGVLFDAEIINPLTRRQDIRVITAWDCDGIRWCAQRQDDQNWWMATLAIPWRSLSPSGDLATIWRANLTRIERPAAEPPEFSCWSPTMAHPADFHRPAFFGALTHPT